MAKRSSITTQRQPGAFHPAFERLESRTLMAVLPTATLNAGVLRIEGTDQPDTIIVQQANYDIRIDGIKIQSGKALLNAVKAAGVKQIEINGRGGNDKIDLTGVCVPAKIDGGAGDDSIVGTQANDVIRGADGDDRIFAKGGRDTVDGGAGNDVLDGGDGEDILVGDVGNDVLAGGNGNDALLGGLDTLERDVFFGQQGTDRFLLPDCPTTERIKDLVLAEDAVFYFAAKGSKWTTDDVLTVDEALGAMYNATGSLKAIKPPAICQAPRGILFARYGSGGESIGNGLVEYGSAKFKWRDVSYGWCNEIGLYDGAFADRDVCKRMVWHEMGHLWEKAANQFASIGSASKAAVQDFYTVGGWIPLTGQVDASKYYLSGDRKWCYLKSLPSAFAPTHYHRPSDQKVAPLGTHNRSEDWATSVEAYFRLHNKDGHLTSSELSALKSCQARLNKVGKYIAAL